MAETTVNQNKDGLKDVELNANIKVKCIVKGYQECEFDVNIGEEFLAELRKASARGAP